MGAYTTKSRGVNSSLGLDLQDNKHTYLCENATGPKFVHRCICTEMAWWLTTHIKE